LIKAYILSTGNELLLGTTIDSNSVYLSKKLRELGIKVIGKITVGDTRENLESAFRLAISSAEVVICTGGLGPTFDDLTKEVVCGLMKCKMQINQEIVDNLKAYFISRNRPMPDNNLSQAMFPPEATILPNRFGTAPGMYLPVQQDKKIILLPGPPCEMRNMYVEEVEPRLKEDFNLQQNKSNTRIIKVFGPGESQVDQILAGITKEVDKSNIALLAHDGEVHIRITAEDDQENSSEVLEPIVEAVKVKLKDKIYGYDNDNLVSVVVQLLKERGQCLASAESCTGGLLSKLITDMPGSSEIFWGSVVSYSNQAKMKLLGVSPETLENYGAVSRETAREMAIGIRKVSGADYGLSITGIAGPDGGTKTKPVGLVYIALAADNTCIVKELRSRGNRKSIRIISTKSVLDLLRRQLLAGGISS